MLYVHFNGEVVRGPDMVDVARRTREKHIEQGRCKFGKCMLLCKAYRTYMGREYIRRSKHELYPCKLFKYSTLCPGLSERIERGKIAKFYKMNWMTYRRISSSAHYLIKTAEYKTVFLALTFPKWLKEHKLTKSFFYDEITNKLFSKFIENLRSNYHCAGYVAVKEYGKINNRVHFHLLASLPFIDFVKLNSVWNHTISDFCEFSPCALRTNKKHEKVIRSPARAIRYVCKYFYKSFGRSSTTRIYFISNNLNIRPVKFQESGNEYREILKGYNLRVINYEYVTIFKLASKYDFNRFCRDFLYPAFIKLSEQCRIMNDLCQFYTEKIQV